MNLIHVFAAGCTSHTFLGLLPWYYYLSLQPSPGGGCEVQNFILLGSNSSLLLVLLAIVEDLLRLAGLFAVIYVIYAGFKYIMSQGSPDETGKALATIRNAIAGLVIAIITIPLVSYLAGRFVGGGGGNSGRVAGLDLSSLPNPGGVDNGKIIASLLSVTFNVVGALALLFIVIGGYSYVVSNGEGPKVAKAKLTIIYALIGLAVAVVAQSIISFVVHQL